MICAALSLALVILFSLSSTSESSSYPIRGDFPGIYSHSEKRGPLVALTIDDGPHRWYTPRLLSLLEELEVKASFFLVGKLCIRYPELVKKIGEGGHLICNHSFNHWNMTRLPYSRLLFEWDACSEAIENCTGIRPRFCRPPGGRFNEDIIKSARSRDLMVIGWTINSLDCAGKSPAQIINTIVSHLQPGAIILVHDGFESTIKALPVLVKEIRRRGYSLVTLDAMFP
jgi:peptidoglycan/xylan/chitin deacetylase (PgdA/CDA1 family)